MCPGHTGIFHRLGKRHCHREHLIRCARPLSCQSPAGNRRQFSTSGSHLCMSSSGQTRPLGLLYQLPSHGNSSRRPRRSGVGDGCHSSRRRVHGASSRGLRSTRASERQWLLQQVDGPLWGGEILSHGVKDVFIDSIFPDCPFRFLVMSSPGYFQGPNVIPQPFEEALRGDRGSRSFSSARARGHCNCASGEEQNTIRPEFTLKTQLGGGGLHMKRSGSRVPATFTGHTVASRAFL